MLLLKTGPKSADQKREMEVNVALSLALKRGAVEWVKSSPSDPCHSFAEL